MQLPLRSLFSTWWSFGNGEECVLCISFWPASQLGNYLVSRMGLRSASFQFLFRRDVQVIKSPRLPASSLADGLCMPVEPYPWVSCLSVARTQLVHWKFVNCELHQRLLGGKTQCEFCARSTSLNKVSTYDFSGHRKTFLGLGSI